jgi:hypothetical protein
MTCRLFGHCLLLNRLRRRAPTLRKSSRPPNGLCEHYLLRMADILLRTADIRDGAPAEAVLTASIAPNTQSAHGYDRTFPRQSLRASPINDI